MYMRRASSDVVLLLHSFPPSSFRLNIWLPDAGCDCRVHEARAGHAADDHHRIHGEAPALGPPCFVANRSAQPRDRLAKAEPSAACANITFKAPETLSLLSPPQGFRAKGPYDPDADVTPPWNSWQQDGSMGAGLNLLNALAILPLNILLSPSLHLLWSLFLFLAWAHAN